MRAHASTCVFQLEPVQRLWMLLFHFARWQHPEQWHCREIDLMLVGGGMLIVCAGTVLAVPQQNIFSQLRGTTGCIFLYQLY